MFANISEFVFLVYFIRRPPKYANLINGKAKLHKTMQGE